MDGPAGDAMMEPGGDSTMPRGPEGRRRQVKFAAIRCFERAGVRKTSIEDISAEAGLSRRTIYYLFRNRQDIIFDILYDRIVQIAEKAKAATDMSNFEVAAVTSSVATIQLVLSDPVYQAIHADDPSIGILGPGEQRLERMNEVTLSIFEAVFHLGRAEGAIRNNLADVELADWIRGFHYLLVVRQLHSASEIGEMIRKFFLPSLR